MSANLCGFTISPYDLHEHAKLIARWAKQKQGKWIVTLNLQMLSEGALNKIYDQRLHEADLFVADGMPIFWFANLKNKNHLKGRTAGIELVELLLKKYPDLRCGIIGGENPKLALQILCRNIQDFHIYDGRVQLTQTWLTNYLSSLSGFEPELILVALGEPKQTHFIHMLKPIFPNSIIIGVGGSFELISGTKARAPKWMQQSGLEWLHRLLLEPKRLWKRYLLGYPIGLTRLFINLLRSSKPR